MNRKYRTAEIAAATFVLGLICGYATRLIRLPLPDVTADLRPRLTADPYLPDSSAIGTAINAVGPLAIKTSPDAIPPDFVVLDIDSRDSVAGIHFLYHWIDDDFDLKSELVSRYGQFEKQITMDRPDFGLFRDNQRGLVWAAAIEDDDDSVGDRRSAVLSVHSLGAAAERPVVPPGTRVDPAGG
ncbi:hypothetical protein [Stieleria varia]|uniref:Uncharacterized protein n=1 Tax=Stieleria varia TaxID=2528005 RepID=A0A5C6AMX3_9BACT|nr:hypothetical protein [Stieleria varia]TWU01010.1 hypothetical protein Pla52n_43810 [Stieleria varia]